MNDHNPYAPPTDESLQAGTKNPKRGRYTARFDGDKRDALVLSGKGPLPAVCMKCGTHHEIVRRMAKFQWTPVWARFLVFCLIGAILMMVTTKRATLEVPLCVRCNARWGTARNVGIAGVVALLGAFAVMRFGEDALRTLGLVLLAVVIVAFVAVSLLYVKPRMLQAKRIDDTAITLKGVAPSAAQEIVDGSS